MEERGKDEARKSFVFSSYIFFVLQRSDEIKIYQEAIRDTGKQRKQRKRQRYRDTMEERGKDEEEDREVMRYKGNKR